MMVEIRSIISEELSSGAIHRGSFTKSSHSKISILNSLYNFFMEHLWMVVSVSSWVVFLKFKDCESGNSMTFVGFLQTLWHICSKCTFSLPPTKQKTLVFWCFQGAEKGCFANKWVNWNAFSKKKKLPRTVLIYSPSTLIESKKNWNDNSNIHIIKGY